MTPDDSFTLPGAGKGRGHAGLVRPRITVRGVLTFDSIESRCGYLETATGARFEVLYPAGWVLDRMSGLLRGPDGATVEAGAEIEVEGELVRDRSSTCQVGPIVEAIRVAVAPA